MNVLPYPRSDWLHFKGGPYDGQSKHRRDLYFEHDEKGTYVQVFIPRPVRIDARIFSLTGGPISPEAPPVERIEYRYREWADGCWRGLSPIPLDVGTMLVRLDDGSTWAVQERIDYESTQVWLRCALPPVDGDAYAQGDYRTRVGDDQVSSVDHLAEFGRLISC